MRAFLFFACCLQAVFLSAQEALQPDTIVQRFWRQTCLFPSEKIYVQTDRTVYAGGDTIWFRAFVVNALDNMKETASRYVYTELVDPLGEIVQRVRIKQDADSLFYGYLPLDEFAADGTYTLRAYTRYMENQGEAFFFRKSLQVVSPWSKDVEVTASVRPNGGKWAVDLSCIEKAGSKAVNLEKAHLFGKGKEELRHTPLAQGTAFCYEADAHSLPVVRLEIGNYSRFIPLRPEATDYQVDFFPEGGTLLAGVMQKVAFKALNDLGESEEIEGVLYNGDGKQVSAFSTSHAGMGSFSWIPEAGKNYYVECTSKGGLKKRFDLPAPEQNRYALQVHRSERGFVVSVNSSVAEESRERLNVLVHQRGLPLLAHSLVPPYTALRLDKASISPGVVNIVLLDFSGKILSERLVFIKQKEGHSLEIVPDRAQYGTRDLVKLTTQLHDASGQPLDGDFLLAVTNDSDVLPDSTSSIQSSLLLSADLRGYIDDPEWYFREDSRERDECLDLLMLTHGWRKYHVEEALKETYVSPQQKPELSMQVKGSVKRLVGNKGMEDAKVRLLIPEQHVVEEKEVDGKGCFRWDLFEFPDSTMYYLSAVSGKGSNHVLLELETETFPSCSLPCPPLALSSAEDISQEDDGEAYLDKLKQQAMAEGNKLMFLDELVVSGKRKVPRTVFESILGAVSVRSEEIRESTMEDVGLFITSKFPGLVYNEGKFESMRGVGMSNNPEAGEVQIVLNGFPVDREIAAAIVKSLRVADLEQVDFSRTPVEGLAWFPMTGASFLAITLRKDATLPPAVPRNMQVVQLLGYQKPAAFYAPEYDTGRKQEADKSDRRTTLYWKPVVQLDNGRAEVSFYTSDETGTCTVLMEGITSNGLLIRQQKMIQIVGN